MAKDIAFPAMVIGVSKKKIELGKFARPGCLRFKRWQILLTMDGKTVSDYYRACREAGIPCTANNPRDAAKKELITLSAPQ